MRVNVRLVGISLVFYACAIFSMYTSGPYFLLSYFSIGDSDQQYDGPQLLDIKPGDFLLSTKTVTSVSETVDTNDLSLLLSCTFHAPPLYNMSCPSNFHYTQGLCEQNQAEELSFIYLALDTTQDATKFSESPEDVENFQFSFGSDVPSQVGLGMRILQFQEDSSDCENEADCDQYVEYLREQNYGIDYDYDSIRCYHPEAPQFANWPMHGCALAVDIGNSTNCFNDDIDLICDFALFFSLYEQPPAIFTAANLWKWGVIAYINVEFIFIFTALVYCRWLHLTYLTTYYFYENLFTLQQHITYDFKLTFMGEQFTDHKGVFILNDPWRGVIFDFPVHVQFPEADVEKMKRSSVVVRGKFRPDHHYSSVYFEVDWPEEFANAAATVPSVKVEFRQRIPVRVKSRWNVILFPIFFLINMTPLGASRSRYIGFKTYCALALFNTVIQLSWMVPVFFTLISLVPWEDLGMDNLYNWIWGSLYHRPPLTMMIYILFLVLMLLTMIMNVVCTVMVFRVNSRKSVAVEVHLTHSDSMTVNDASYSTYDSSKSSAVDHSVVDYVPMSDLDSKKWLGPDGEQLSLGNLSKQEVARMRLQAAAAEEEKEWKRKGWLRSEEIQKDEAHRSAVESSSATVQEDSKLAFEEQVEQRLAESKQNGDNVTMGGEDGALVEIGAIGGPEADGLDLVEMEVGTCRPKSRLPAEDKQ